MKRRTIKNPVRQYKQMMCQLGKLKDKLRDIMEAIPPCYAYDTLPISFDVDKFIASLTGKGIYLYCSDHGWASGCFVT